MVDNEIQKGPSMLNRKLFFLKKYQYETNCVIYSKALKIICNNVVCFNIYFKNNKRVAILYSHHSI